jgi:hypothetical protein
MTRPDDLDRRKQIRTTNQVLRQWDAEQPLPDIARSDAGSSTQRPTRQDDTDDNNDYD